MDLDTEDRSRDIDDKPRDQNPIVADGNEMSDSLPKDPDAGFQHWLTYQGALVRLSISH